ncbi:MAG: M48 family metallopeptidase [Candidatus Pacebacteria bacterium]|nr:M48 family metallopeptidase [Candidatus Paceibacterota bacterium]
MPTLYSAAASNTRKTWILISMFLILIIFIGWILSQAYESADLLIYATVFAILTSIGGYWFSDKLVLAMARAKPVKHDDYPDLYHVVENLSITAGLPMPKVYIIDEAQPNAFATGRDKKHAVVAVTRGLLERLDKPELEGVIAHEMSHIKNKDILLGTVIVVFTGIIVNISDLFWRMGRRSKSRNSQGGNILQVIAIVSMILAPIAAMLIKLAISRKREFLADASGALLTRYPDGLARALQKISQDPTPMRSAKNATAHLYIINPFKGKSLANLFMTHPPTEQRIKALMDLKI